MKRIAFVLMFACIVFSSCNNDSIKYKGPDVINIVLQEKYNIDADSKEPIVYSSDNNLIVDIIDNGTILGKNVGEANVTLSNESDELTIPVIVSLFEEPTLDFYCSPSDIEDIYGTPRYKNDSLYVYGSGDNWYSFAVWEMDFFFIDNKYVESDLYIKKDLDIRVDEYLKEKFFFKGNLTDTINNEIMKYDIYLNSETQENATVMIGKIKDAGPYKDVRLFYIPYNYTGTRGYNYKDIICRDRSRK